MTEEIQNQIVASCWNHEDVRDLRRCAGSRLLASAYGSRILRPVVLKIVDRLEAGQFYSFTIRDILNRHHGVYVGAYSYGACLIPGAIPSGVVFGRYCSVAHGLRVFLKNHPHERLSMHPFFYNPACGIVPDHTVDAGTLKIEHDAWIGENVIVTAKCKRIGIGAVVGAGAVVTKDVSDFAIVGGNPARLIRYRFPEDLCESIRQSQWWNLPISECRRVLADMVRPLSNESYPHPLLEPTMTQPAACSHAESQ